jgi:hypothetical protein
MGWPNRYSSRNYTRCTSEFKFESLWGEPDLSATQYQYGSFTL